MTFLDAVLHAPMGEISARARQVEFRRVVLTVLAGVLFGAGWLAYKVASVAWRSLVWCVVAVRVGWDAAHERAKAG